MVKEIYVFLVRAVRVLAEVDQATFTDKALLLSRTSPKEPIKPSKGKPRYFHCLRKR